MQDRKHDVNAVSLTRAHQASVPDRFPKPETRNRIDVSSNLTRSSYVSVSDKPSKLENRNRIDVGSSPTGDSAIKKRRNKMIDPNVKLSELVANNYRSKVGTCVYSLITGVLADVTMMEFLQDPFSFCDDPQFIVWGVDYEVWVDCREGNRSSNNPDFFALVSATYEAEYSSPTKTLKRIYEWIKKLA